MKKILLYIITMMFAITCLTSCGTEPDFYAYKIGLTAQKIEDLTGNEPDYTNGRKAIGQSIMFGDNIYDIGDYSVAHVMYYFDNNDLVNKIWIGLLGQSDKVDAVAKNLGKIYGKFKKINEHQYSRKYKDITIFVTDYENSIEVTMQK